MLRASTEVVLGTLTKVALAAMVMAKVVLAPAALMQAAAGLAQPAAVA